MPLDQPVTGELFLRGLAIGFAVAFALGPIGLLVIRRTLDRGWALGFVSGVGVATADAIYAAIAAFGLTAVTQVLVDADRTLGLVGGMVLLALAARSLGRAGAGGASPVPEQGIVSGPLERPLLAWASMVALTVTNPATILSFAALFASIGAGTGGTPGASAVVAGVFIGSVGWWALLTGLVAGLRTRLTPGAIRILNIVSALVIGGFGVAAVAFGIVG